MFKFVTPGLGLLLLSLCVSFFPHWFVFHKYERERANFPSSRKFLCLYLLQAACFFTYVILGFLIWVFFARGNLSQVLAIFSMFYPSIFLPPALFSTITGIYPVMERKGYYYYENHKSSLGETLVSTDEQHLKTVGWLQSILFIVIIGVALAYVIW